MVPFVAAVIFSVTFISLGMWQLDRAAEKTELLDKFFGDAPYETPDSFVGLADFERIAATGRYRNDRQVLVENIPLEGRIGYYVVTPFELSTGGPLLLVNRGWVQKGSTFPDIDVDNDYRTIEGLAGRLPRVGIRPGEAFAENSGWPRVGLYPTHDEVAAALGEPVLPTALLLQEEGGFVQRWQPSVSGPATHYGYAVQWFAMTAAVLGLTFWHWRRRRQHGN